MSATTIKRAQIRDGAIDNAKIDAAAAIATSKLADGANFLKKDGSVAMTGALNMGNQLITNVNTPSSGTDAANKNYVDNAVSGVTSLFTSKGTVRTASTANINLATPGASINGVTMAAGDRFLAKDQTTQSQNGVYVWNGAAVAATRAADMDSWAEIPGAWITAQEGTADADTVWLSTANAGGTLGTTAITFTKIPTSTGLSSSNFVENETPSGAINGSNTAFTLANTPTAGTVKLYLNGIRQIFGAGADATISGSTITMLTAPETGDVLVVDYMK